MPCAKGTIRSCSPCQMLTGTVIAARSKPHGRTNARSSSCQPAMPFSHRLAEASRRSSSASSPVSTCLSTSGTRPPRAAATSGPATERSCSCSLSRYGVRASEPCTARPNSSMFSGPMPAVTSSPSASHGATPATDAAARHRSGSERRTGERVRAAAGVAHRDELAGAEVVEDRDRCRHRVGDRPPGLRRRAAVAGPAVGHQAQPVLGCGARHRQVGHRRHSAYRSGTPPASRRPAR